MFFGTKNEMFAMKMSRNVTKCNENVMKINVIVDFWTKNEMCTTKMSQNVTKCNEM